MLQNIRDKSTGWFSWLIIGLIVIVFALFGVSRYLGGSRRFDSVATVNGKPISSQVASNLYYRYQTMARQRGLYSPTQSFATFLKKQAIHALTQQSAMLQAAEQDGYALAPVIVQAGIESLPEFKDKGQFSYRKWQAYSQNNPNAAMLIDQLKKQQILNQARSGFMLTGVVTPQQSKVLFAMVNQQRELGFYHVSLSQFSDQAQQEINTKAEQAYYAKHKSRFKTPEQVQLQYIELSLKAIMDSIKPTPQQLQEYYQNNMSQYTTPAAWKVHKITVPVNGSDVGAARKQLKSIATNLQKGGSLPQNGAASVKTVSLSARNLGPDLLSTLSALQKSGDVSQPVHDPQGMSIYQLIQKTTAKQQAFAAVKAKVERAVKQSEAQDQFNSASDQLASLTFANPGSLTAAAKALGLTIKSTGFFSRQGAKGIAKNPNVIQAAFSNDVLNSRNNSQVITIDNNAQVVVRVNAYKHAATKPFAQVQAQITQQLQRELEVKAARAMANKLAAAVKAGKSSDDVSDEFDRDFNDLGLVNRRMKRHPQIIYHGFLMAPTEKARVVPGADGYDVVVLNGIEPGKAAKGQTEAKFASALAQSQGQLAYQFYQNSVINNAKIKIINPNFN